jgi:hypothetical protein
MDTDQLVVASRERGDDLVDVAIRMVADSGGAEVVPNTANVLSTEGRDLP